MPKVNPDLDWAIRDLGYVTPCWIWTRSYLKSGYGSKYVPTTPTEPRHTERAHIWSWQQAHGPVPLGLELDHLCRNIGCVNPDHLEPVTGEENRRRQAAVRTACPKGHPYDTTRSYVGGDGTRRTSRRCSTCHNAEEARRATRRRARG